MPAHGFSFIGARLGQTVVLWPEQSIPLLGYRCWPNDSEAAGGLLHTLRSCFGASGRTSMCAGPASRPQNQQQRYLKGALRSLRSSGRTSMLCRPASRPQNQQQRSAILNARRAGNRGKSEGSRLLWFWVKVPNSNSEIGTTRLARARACGTGRRPFVPRKASSSPRFKPTLPKIGFLERPDYRSGDATADRKLQTSMK